MWNKVGRGAQANDDRQRRIGHNRAESGRYDDAIDVDGVYILEILTGPG